MHKLRFNTDAAGLTAQSKKDLAAVFNGLPKESAFNLVVEQVNVKYRNSRYKYYFDCVLRLILMEAGERHVIMNPATGIQRPVRNTAELHYIMKCIYNPVTVTIGRQVYVMPGSTTELNDQDFAGQYSEQIIADYSGTPYLITFPTPPEYAELKRSGHWNMMTK